MLKEFGVKVSSLFERMGGTYTLGTDGMYYPDVVSTDEEPHYGKYGKMRRQYLKGHRPAVYYTYLPDDPYDSTFCFSYGSVKFLPVH